MALLIGGPEEKYARMGLSYPAMMSMVAVEDELRAVTLGESAAQSLHRQAQLVSDGLETLSKATSAAIEIASGPSRGITEYYEGSLSRGLGSLYSDIASAVRSVEQLVLGLEEKLDTAFMPTSRDAVFEFRRDYLSVASNRLTECATGMTASKEPDISRLRAAHEKVVEACTAWRRAEAAI